MVAYITYGVISIYYNVVGRFNFVKFRLMSNVYTIKINNGLTCEFVNLF